MTTSTPSPAPASPAFFTHLTNYHAALRKHARKEKLTDDNGSITVPIFRGKVTQIFAAAGVPYSYYSRATNLLKMMGSIVMLRTGGGRHGVSEVAVMDVPTWEGYEKAVKLLDAGDERRKMVKAIEKSQR